MRVVSDRALLVVAATAVVIADYRADRIVPRESAAHPKRRATGHDAAECLVRVHGHVRERFVFVHDRPAVVEHEFHVAGHRYRPDVHGAHRARQLRVVARKRRARGFVADEHPDVGAAVQTTAEDGQHSASRSGTATRMNACHLVVTAVDRGSPTRRRCRTRRIIVDGGRSSKRNGLRYVHVVAAHRGGHL